MEYNFDGKVHEIDSRWAYILRYIDGESERCEGWDVLKEMIQEYVRHLIKYESDEIFHYLCKIYELKLIYSDIKYDDPEREEKENLFIKKIKDCACRLPYLTKVFRSKEMDVLRERGTMALKFKRVECNQLEVNNE
jgi:hypothetical protein